MIDGMTVNGRVSPTLERYQGILYFHDDLMFVNTHAAPS